jgi:hypothetical protein
MADTNVIQFHRIQVLLLWIVIGVYILVVNNNVSTNHVIIDHEEPTDNTYEYAIRSISRRKLQLNATINSTIGILEPLQVQSNVVSCKIPRVRYNRMIVVYIKMEVIAKSSNVFPFLPASVPRFDLGRYTSVSYIGSGTTWFDGW